jgi:superfamily II DNA/RNA helicase
MVHDLNPPPLRSYQARIVQEVVTAPGNALVVLPTGAGKTRIAAEIIAHRRQHEACVAPQAAPQQQQQQQRKACVFFVPKVVLIEQQAAALAEVLRRSEPTLKIAMVGGGEGIQGLSGAGVIVATPEAFVNAQQNGTAPPWSLVSLVVFDELHHHLKNDPYRRITASMRVFNSDKDNATAVPTPPRMPGVRSPLHPTQDMGPERNSASNGMRLLPPLPPHIKVVGLTATVSYAMEAATISKVLHEMRMELEIAQVSFATRDELTTAGFLGAQTKTEVCTPPPASRLYLQQCGLDRMLPLSDRQPHRVMEQICDRVFRGLATPAMAALLRCVLKVEEYITAKIDTSFVSPVKSGEPLRTWSDSAFRRAMSVGGDQAAKGKAYALLMYWYDAASLAIVSWEELAVDLAPLYLRKYGCDKPAAGFDCADAGVCDATSAFFAMVDSFDDSPRLVHLVDVLTERASAKFRGILFCEQRVVAHMLKAFIEDDPALRELFRCAVLHAETPATRFLRVSKADAEKALDDFRSGAVNLLVATTVAEEGMDVQAANCVIRFDPVHTPVSNVQGRGRARDADSTYTLMREAPGKAVAQLNAAEAAQLHALTAATASGAVPSRMAVTATRATARRDHQKAVGLIRGGGNESVASNATQAFNTYCQQTGTAKDVKVTNVGNVFSPRFECVVTVLTPLSETPLVAKHQASTKKEAEREACANVVGQLIDLRL